MNGITVRIFHSGKVIFFGVKHASSSVAPWTFLFNIFVFLSPNGELSCNMN